MKWPGGKGQKDEQWSTKHCTETKDTTKNEGELWCFDKVSSSRYASGTKWC